MGREISAGIIIYRRTPEGVKFLLLYHGGGYWNFPKGRLEEGERSFRAAVREVQEETGIRYRDLRFTRSYFRAHNRFVFQRGADKISKHVLFYLAETRNPLIRLSSEHEGYGWFLYDRALRMITHKNLRDILSEAYDAISGKSTPSNRPYSARPRRNVRGHRTDGRVSRGSTGGGAGALSEPARA